MHVAGYVRQPNTPIGDSLHIVTFLLNRALHLTINMICGFTPSLSKKADDWNTYLFLFVVDSSLCIFKLDLSLAIRSELTKF